jgi:hypothetical protein
MENWLICPIFLWMSLTKIPVYVQKHKENKEHNPYHYGMIKLIVMAELSNYEFTWDLFLQ